MNQNSEIIKIAKTLGLRIQGLSEEEQVFHIAEQLGLNNYNPIYDFDELLNRLNYLDHQNQIDTVNNFQDSTSVIPETRSVSSNPNSKSVPFRNNQMSSSLPSSLKKDVSKDDEAIKRLNENRNINNYNQQAFNQNQQIVEEQSNKQQDNKVNNAKEKIAKEALDFVGVPSFLSKPLSKQVAKDNGGIGNVTSATINIPMPAIAAGLIAVVALIIVIVVCMTGLISEDDESELNSQREVTSYIKGDIEFSELSETLVYMNLCMANDNSFVEEQQCLASNPGKFFTHLKKLYTDYQNYKDINGNSVLLDVALILETISYYRTDSQLFDDNTFDDMIKELDTLSNAMVEKYQEIGDLYYEEEYIAYYVLGKPVKKKRCLNKSNQVVYSSNGQAVYYRISDDKYISYLKYGEVHENYDGKVKVYDVDIHPDSDSVCIPSGRMYQSSDVVRYVGH